VERKKHIQSKHLSARNKEEFNSSDTDKAIAAIVTKDDEKKSKIEIEKNKKSSLGSANAFEGTEEVKE